MGAGKREEPKIPTRQIKYKMGSCSLTKKRQYSQKEKEELLKELEALGKLAQARKKKN